MGMEWLAKEPPAPGCAPPSPNQRAPLCSPSPSPSLGAQRRQSPSPGRQDPPWELDGAAQCQRQRELVQRLEQQLERERQRLGAMRAQLSGAATAQPAPPTAMAAKGQRFPLGWPHAGAPLPAPKGVLQPSALPPLWGSHGAAAFSDLGPSLEFYRLTTARPPFTYATLIRWAILESPDRQLTLNEIYHWFSRMFGYFRHNSATWKNAVRHNLSLHKCFVRVEHVKGAVWTVDETEFQKKRSLRFPR
ncbi:forkhead box protein P3 [Carettochelys insculpta]|uniref:forkhead box protein P3 n=1 Tax=Carettochelys insculpta TaxID=44489 RepID=UPI003EC0596C